MRAIRWDESNCDRWCDLHETTRDGHAINECHTHGVWWYTPTLDEILDL